MQRRRLAFAQIPPAALLATAVSCAAPRPSAGAPCDGDVDCAGLGGEPSYCALELAEPVCLPGASAGVVARVNRPPFMQSALVVTQAGSTLDGTLTLIDLDPGQTPRFLEAELAVGLNGSFLLRESGAYTLAFPAGEPARVESIAVQATDGNTVAMLHVSVVIASGSGTTWTGAVGEEWGTAANWSAGAPNEGTDALVVPALTQPRVDGERETRDLIATAGSAVAFDGPLTAYGSRVLLGGRSTSAGAGALALASADAVTVSGALPPVNSNADVIVIGTATTASFRARLVTVEQGARLVAEVFEGAAVLASEAALDLREATVSSLRAPRSAHVSVRGDLQVESLDGLGARVFFDGSGLQRVTLAAGEIDAQIGDNAQVVFTQGATLGDVVLRGGLAAEEGEVAVDVLHIPRTPIPTGGAGIVRARVCDIPRIEPVRLPANIECGASEGEGEP